MRTEQQEQQQQPAAARGASRVTNPPPGAVLVTPAGGRAEASFDFVNDAPFVAAFHLEAAGLPGPEWCAGAGEAAKQYAPASGGGTLTLVLTPPPDAAPGQYDLRVRLLSQDGPVGREVPLVLQVERGAPAPPAAPPAVTPGSAATAPAVPPVTGMRDAELVLSPGAGREEPPTPTAPVGYAPPPLPPVRTPTEPQPEPLLIRQTQAQTQGQPVRPVPPPPVAPPPDEPLPLVDLAEQADAAQEARVREPSVLDPKDGDTFSLAPGTTLLLRFRITNDGRRERTYVIDEDRSLDSRWINIVTDQIHLMHNGSDELTARLSAPASAEPGLYPFQVRVGPADGVLTPYHFLLSVTATPAVRLTAKQEKVSFGPFSAHADFLLTVESAGNADTAFRVAVKAPRQEGDEQPRPDDLYETPQWRYLFDRELDNLEALSPGHPRKPKQVRLRIARKGIWWLGVRESHTVRVAVVPVTDPGNGGRGGNSVEVTALHWRPAPVPAFALAPLALLLLLLFVSGGAHGLRVVDPTYEAPDGHVYVVREPVKDAVTARLTWDAPWYSPYRLVGEGKKVAIDKGFVRPPEDVAVPFKTTGDRVLEPTMSLKPLFGSGPSLPVRFIRARPDTPLQIGNATPLGDGVYQMELPPDGRPVRLELRNVAKQANRINYWLARLPGPAYVVDEFLDSGTLDPPAFGGAPLVIKVWLAQPGKAAAEDEMVFVTTDAKHPLARVRLKPAAGGK